MCYTRTSVRVRDRFPPLDDEHRIAHNKMSGNRPRVRSAKNLVFVRRDNVYSNLSIYHKQLTVKAD